MAEHGSGVDGKKLPVRPNTIHLQPPGMDGLPRKGSKEPTSQLQASRGGRCGRCVVYRQEAAVEVVFSSSLWGIVGRSHRFHLLGLARAHFQIEYTLCAHPKANILIDSTFLVLTITMGDR